MNRIEQAAADLRDAEAALKAYVPKEQLLNSVNIARDAVIAAARDFRASESMLAEMPTADQVADKKDEMLEGVKQQLEADTETNIVVEEEIFEDDPVTEGASLAELSAAAADVMETVKDAIDSATTTNETMIDATDEVSLEEAITHQGEDAVANPNGMLGQNYPRADA